MGRGRPPHTSCAVEVVEAEAAVDEEAALAREIVRGHDGGGEGGAWCHHIMC